MKNSQRRTKRHTRVFISLILGLLAIGYLGYYFYTPITDGSVYARSSSSKSKTEDMQKIATMNQTINSIIAQYPAMQISVSVTDLASDQSYNYGVEVDYIAASVAKLITASLYLHEVEQGNRTLNEYIGGYTAEHQLQQLIELSDNNAWHTLNEELGNDLLQAWAEEAGLQSYNAVNNTISPSDITLLLANLYTDRLLDTQHTKLLLSYMQNADNTEYIKSAVPNNITVYHKAGWLDDRVHDTAIIDNGQNPYVLTIFSKTDGTYDAQIGQDMFHQITAATLEAFTK